MIIGTSHVILYSYFTNYCKLFSILFQKTFVKNIILQFISERDLKSINAS